MKSSLKFSVLASGSKGNVCYIETENTGILIDAGLSCRETERRLRHIGITSPKIDALFITHEHADHIKGAGPLARRFDIPVFINRRTYLKKQASLGNIEKPVIIQTGQTIMVNDLKVETFTKCHDAVDPMGITVSLNGAKIGIATDMGRLTRLAIERLRDCNAIVVEFNHDQKMLEEGPYPLSLKRRIKGPDGHLSNEQGAELVRSVYGKKLEHVILAHLSKENNHPELALSSMHKTIDEYRLSCVKVRVSNQDEPTPIIPIK